MKPEELRVNNWYMSTKFQCPVKCELSDMCEIYHRADGAEPNEDDVASVFEPIPLTEEWLIRLGFNQKRVKMYFQFENFEYCTGNYVVDNGFAIVNEKPIKYVHEMQNLIYSITGKEL